MVKPVKPVDEEKLIVRYDTDRGEVSLNIEIIQRRFCPDATASECFEFMQFCKFTGLNPYLGQVYLVKYGQRAAQPVVDYHQFIAKARRGETYLGYTSGLIVERDGETIRLDSAFYEKADVIAGAWCIVRRSDTTPVKVELPIEEMIGTTRAGATNSMWRNKPGMMAEKTVIAMAHRRATDGALSGMFIPEEFSDLQNGGESGPREGGAANQTTLDEETDADVIVSQIFGDDTPDNQGV